MRLAGDAVPSKVNSYPVYTCMYVRNQHGVPAPSAPAAVPASGKPVLRSVFFDYDDDTVMAERRGKFLSLTNQEGLLFMRQRGYEHVQKMAAEGKLDCIREAAQHNAAG